MCKQSGALIDHYKSGCFQLTLRWVGEEEFLGSLLSDNVNSGNTLRLR